MFFIKYIVNYLKRYYKIEHGTEFVDALRLINRDSEVSVPNELIPAGVLMQLRGLFNLHALSINNDWVWPYWIERQFNPKSTSFIPRAMSLTYINLTHRNWTAVGVLGGTREAVVDPRGALMPWMQGWSLDAWINVEGEWSYPSRLPQSRVRQLLVENLPIVRTEVSADGVIMRCDAWCFRNGETDYAVLETTVENKRTLLNTDKLPVQLALSIRPYNGEGVSLIKDLAYNTKGFWNMQGKLAVFFPQRPQHSLASTHEDGDVSLFMDQGERDTNVQCEVGMATGASVFNLELAPGDSLTRYAVMPLEPLNPRVFQFNQFDVEHLKIAREEIRKVWKEKLAQGVTVELPDPRYQACFDANKAFILLLNDGHEITAGPLTYHRHWFRDASYMLNAMGKMGYAAEVAENLRYFPIKQWKNGYFCSQKGEWDSNGEALWAIVEHYRLTGDLDLLRELYPSIRRAVLWIEKKRHDVSYSRGKPRGLLPAGFSAEHLGPNDFYYWDNFWSLRGVLDASHAAKELGYEKDAEVFRLIAERYLKDLKEAMNRDIEHSKVGALPAAPRRRPDAGMIGNIAAAYPLKLFKPEDTPWLRNTVTFIRNHLFHGEGFYQQMIHSGVNSYLTLQMAQCMLLMGDIAAYNLIDYMLSLATPTYCWPEAIHPRTLGGCMGDGHHGWAASDWVLLIRNLIVHEQDDVLQVTRLIPAEWCLPGEKIAIMNAPTFFGVVSVAVEFSHGTETLTIHANWRKAPREIHWFLPADGRRVVGPAKGVVLDGRIAKFGPEILRVKVEVLLEEAASKSQAEIPGLRDLPQ